MKILVVNANTTESITGSARSVAAPGTEIVGLTSRFGAASVEGNLESHLTAVGVMDRVLAYPGPFDAVIQTGYGEHGGEGLQELLDVPVVDITEAAASTAMYLGHRYSVVTTLDRTVPLIEDRLLAGLDRRCASVRSTGPPVDGVSAAVTVAESLVRLDLSTSKVRTYAAPRKKAITGWPLTGEEIRP
jgi:allantoin racemase